MAKLQGRVALVTGAGQGVGRGIALALAAGGAAVAVCGRSAEKLHDTVAQIHARGGKAVALTADIKDGTACAALVEHTVARLGGLHILVNNAQEVPLGGSMHSARTRCRPAGTPGRWPRSG